MGSTDDKLQKMVDCLESLKEMQGRTNKSLHDINTNVTYILYVVGFMVAGLCTLFGLGVLMQLKRELIG